MPPDSALKIRRLAQGLYWLPMEALVTGSPAMLGNTQERVLHVA